MKEGKLKPKILTFISIKNLFTALVFSIHVSFSAALYGFNSLIDNFLVSVF